MYAYRAKSVMVSRWLEMRQVPESSRKQILVGVREGAGWVGLLSCPGLCACRAG